MSALEFTGPSLLRWCRVESNWPGESMVYAGAMKRQVLFVRDTLPLTWAQSADEYARHSNYDGEGGGTQVIATHRSKSITLPVYGLDVPRLGLRAVVRDNFHNWKVSIAAERPIDLAPMGHLVDPTERVHSVYCEGFREEWVLGSHATDPRRFTVEMSREHDVYAMFLLIAHQLRAVAS